MRRFIYNTQGTGISHRQIARLENTQPGPGTYLGGDMRDLGDEIMLLDGIDGNSDALEALGYVGAGNYRSRAIDIDGFTIGSSELPSSRRSSRDFRPWGLADAPVPPSMMANRARADLRPVYPASGGGRPHPGGRKQSRDFDPWGLGETPEVSLYTAAKNSRPDLFIGPNFYPLDAVPREERAGRDFRPWGLAEGEEVYANPQPAPATWLDGFAESGTRLIDLSTGQGDDWSYEAWSSTPPPGTWLQGFGDAAADRRQALSVAQSIANACRSACGLISEANPTATAAAQGRCRSGCDAAYGAAEAAINGAIPQGTSGPMTPEQQAVINAKLDALRYAQQQAASGEVPTGTGTGLTTNQMLIGGALVVGLGVLAIVALRR